MLAIAGSYIQFAGDFVHKTYRISNLGQPVCLSEFNGLWYLLSCLSVKRAKQLREKVNQALGIRLREDGGGKGFDSWPLQDRFNALITVFWILDQWPDRFIQLISGTKLSKSVFSENIRSIPYWLMRIIDEYGDRSRYVPTDEEVLSAVCYLKSRDEAISAVRLAKLLNLHTSSCRDRLAQLRLKKSV